MFVHDAWTAAIGNGRAYILGSGRVTLAVAGNVRGLLTNPAGSDRNVTLVGMTAFATALGWVQVLLNPTTGLPTSEIRPNLPLHPAPQVAVAQMRIDTSAITALAGGTDTGVVIALPAGAARQITPLGLVLAPGMSLGLSIPFAASADLAFSLYVVEE
jgi:hypothetical protein